MLPSLSRSSAPARSTTITIFPRGYLKDVGRSGELDSVLNHMLIDSATNTRIGKRAPSVYLAEIRTNLGHGLDEVLASHHLPADEHGLLATNEFDAFLTWRVEQLTDALAKKAGGVGTTVARIAPHLARLDSRIEAVELRLRGIILERLGNDASLLPSPVAQKARERIVAATRKHPGTAGVHRQLSQQLEYLDFRELQDTITAKPLWPRFQSIFATKETLVSRFDQLAELRNAIRHSRTVGNVTTKDGEAALL